MRLACGVSASDARFLREVIIIGKKNERESGRVTRSGTVYFIRNPQKEYFVAPGVRPGYFAPSLSPFSSSSVVMSKKDCKCIACSGDVESMITLSRASSAAKAVLNDMVTGTNVELLIKAAVLLRGHVENGEFGKKPEFIAELTLCVNSALAAFRAVQGSKSADDIMGVLSLFDAVYAHTAHTGIVGAFVADVTSAAFGRALLNMRNQKKHAPPAASEDAAAMAAEQ